MKWIPVIYLFKSLNRQAADSLFSLEELLGDSSSKSTTKLEADKEDFDTGRRNAAIYPNRPKVTAKMKPSEEEIFSTTPDDNLTNSVPGTKDIKTFPIKQSIAETVKLDSTVTSVHKSKTMTSGNYEGVAPSENIKEGISDDEDEEMKHQWDEFMKESEEFGEKDKAKKNIDKNLTESDVDFKLTQKNAFDYFSDNPSIYCSKLIKKNDYKEGTTILEEIIVKLESLSDSKIGKYDKDY